MEKELIFCAPFQRQYYTDISKEDYELYVKNGISSTKFWEEIFEDMIYRDWYFGCYAEDDSFDIGYCFSLEVDGEEVEGFQKYFKEIYEKGLKSVQSDESLPIISKESNCSNHDSDSFGISMQIYHDRAEMKMKINGDFDINKFSILIEKASVLGSVEVIKIYTPYYDGEEFDHINLDDENRNDPIIFSNNQYDGLYILEDD